MNETVRLVVSPDECFGVYSFDIPGVDDWELVSRDADTGVEVYTFTMPYQDVTVNVELRETTMYTIFYKAASTVTSVLYRFSTGEAGFTMNADAQADGTACWGGQMRGVVGKTSFQISFKVDDGNWEDQDCVVVDDLTSFSGMSNGSAVLVAGDENAFIAAFMWGYYYTDSNGDLQLRDDLGTRYYFVTCGLVSRRLSSNRNCVGKHRR